jgi:hypothetical protein
LQRQQVDAGDIKEMPLEYPTLGLEADVNYLTQDYLSSIYEGENKLYSMIEDEEAHCPSEKLILVGYSQGAWVIHLALRDLEGNDLAALSPAHLGAVLLLANPAKVGNAAEETWENDPTVYVNYEAGTGLTKADAIWTKIAPRLGYSPTPVGDLPYSVTGRTLACPSSP